MSTPAPTSRPFTFDTVFEGGAVLTPVRPKRVFTLEEVEAIRMEAFAAGERSATAQAEQAAAAALAEAAHAVRQGLGALTRVARRAQDRRCGLGALSRGRRRRRHDRHGARA
jgi:flagellar assembly protein FliH